MSTERERWEALYPRIEKAAKRVAAQWPDVIDAEDLAQSMAVGLMERPGALVRFFTEDERTQQAFLIKVGHQVASDEQRSYDRHSGNYLYDTAEVRGYLERGVLADEEPPSRFRAEIVDLWEGMANLADRKSPYYAEVVNRYVHGIIPEGSTGRSRISRAVEGLTGEMNRIGATRKKERIEGPGSRTVLSNAAAAHRTTSEVGFGA